MQRSDALPGKAKSPRRPWIASLLAFLGVRKRRDEGHWFDHPEMQARIAEAEEDLREGRYQTGSSAEELQRQLDALKK